MESQLRKGKGGNNLGTTEADTAIDANRREARPDNSTKSSPHLLTIFPAMGFVSRPKPRFGPKAVLQPTSKHKVLSPPPKLAEGGTSPSNN